MRNKTFTHSMAAACAVLVAGSAASGSTNFTGNPTTSSGLVWNFAGNSLQSTNVIWAGGSTTRSIDYYASHFTYTGTETESASMGSTSVGGTGWTVGDRVVAIGVVVTNGGDAGAGWLNGDTFIKFNPGGAGTYSAASSVGGSGASTSFSNSVVGDYQLYGTGNFNNEGNVLDFRYRTAGGSTYPLQNNVAGTALLANPFNSFSVLQSGTSAPGQSQISSQTFLINVDYLARAGNTYGFSPNMIGNTIGKLFIQSSLGAGTTPTDVVLTNVAVPAPGALALLGVAGLAGGRRRRA